MELERQIEELRRQAAGRDRLANMVAPGSLDGTADLLPEPPPEEPPKKGKRKVKDTSPRSLAAQIARLEERARRLEEQIFSSLTPWQIVQVARHPQRPYTLDYVAQAFTDFVELHGDRHFGDDPSIVGGIAKLRGEPVMVIGHQKGRTTKENVLRNFGMPKPEGYRKALRLMRMAEHFGLPIVTFIDTPGAYPGLDAEERGQAQAIAEALEGMAALRVPVVSAVIGEGGSGGALAIGVANRVLMLEFSIYSVISPEGCASILFKDASYAERAAEALKLTAPHLMALGVVDAVVKEAPGGAHRDIPTTARSLADAVFQHLEELARLGPDELLEDRYQRFRPLGALAGAAEGQPGPLARIFRRRESEG